MKAGQKGEQIDKLSIFYADRIPLKAIVPPRADVVGP